VTFDNGAYVVPMDQLAASVVMCTFEPDIANSNAFNGTVTQSLPDSEGLALIFHDSVTKNYPYYRLERNNPRDVFRDAQKDDCKEEIKDAIRDILDEAGCNAGYGYLGFAIFAIMPFVARRKK
jgi:hypothetical protein